MWPAYRRWSFISLVVLLIGWPNIHRFLAFHPGKGFSPEKPPHSLRIMTWNVRSFDEFVNKKRDSLGHRAKILDFIGSQHPDIVCLQEFFNDQSPKQTYSNIGYLWDSLHFPYYYFSRDYIRYDRPYEAGVIIFSRYPIIDKHILRYSRPDGLRGTESLISADIQTGKDTIRVYTSHLQSVLFRSKDFHDIEIIKNVDDSILSASRSIAKKLRYAFRLRGDQAEQVARAGQEPVPFSHLRRF